MKKTIATTLAALMLAAVTAGAAQPADAATYMTHPSMHTTVKVVIKHPKHRHQHLVCTTHWRHHHKVRVCFWVPNHK